MLLFLFLVGSLFAQTMNESLIVGDRADIPTDSVFFVNSKKGSILSRLTEVEKLGLIPTFGMIIYNLDKFQYEQYTGTTWIRLGSGLLENWEAGKNYEVGEIKNSGSDGNWLFKVVQDHLSIDVPLDVKAGKLLAISPPLITTGVQEGGEISLSGNTITIQPGTGFIARYSLSASAYPLITIVEWPTLTAILPSTGVYTIYIDESGQVVQFTGLEASARASEDLIGIGIVDMNLTRAFDLKTYPTNPVGQLRGLSFFLGGLTKNLRYAATVLQLARSQFDAYIWGTDNKDPYDPNVKTFPGINPVPFYEFTQLGSRNVPATISTSLLTDAYDLNGNLVTLGNNKWCFARIYTSLATEDYLMYCQKEYSNEANAKEGAISSEFIKPVDLTLTKFSAWLVFEKGDLDLSNNEIIVCEPFGCDKTGTAPSAGGGGGVTVVEDVLTSISTVNALSANQGRVLNEKILALPPSPTPTIVEDNLISTSTTNALSANQGRVLNEKTVENSSAIASNTILIIENSNDIDILFSDIAGLQSSSHSHANKTLLDSLISNGAATLFLAADGTYKTPIDTNTVTTVLDVLTSTSATSALSAAQGKVLNDKITPLQTASHTHANKTLLDSLISNGSATQFLSADGTYKTPVDNVGGTGDVIGPGSATDNAVVRFDTGSGKLIKNSGVLIDASNNIYTPGTINSVGQIWSTAFANAGAVIDFNNGNNQTYSGNCGAITLQNMQDGGIYSLIVLGATSAVCTFSLGANAIHYPPGHGATVANKHTLFSFVKHLNNIYVGWTPDL